MASERSVVVRIRAEIAQFRADMRQAAQATTEMGTAAGTAGTRTSTAMTQAQSAAAATRGALIATGRAAQETAQGMGMSYNATGQLVDEFGHLVTEARAAEAGLETASDATREFASEQQHAASATAAAAAESSSSLGRLADDARNNSEAWDQVGNSMLAFGAAAVAVVGVSITKFASFDKAMSNVEAATHESAANMELLREAAIRTGADTAFSAEEAAQGIEELAKAGVSTADILAGGLDGALDLAAAGALGVGEAAEIAASALTQFKLSGDQIPHLADLLAAGAGKAQGSVQDLGNALNQSGLVAAQTGLSIEETTGGLAAFASAGLVGSDAGTSFKSMLQRLTPQSKEAAKKMEELGISAYDSQGDFIGLTEFAGNLQDSMKGLDSESRNAAMGVIFGSDAVRAASVMYEQGADGVQEWIDNVNDAGYAATTAAIMQDNLAGDIEKLGGAFDTVFIKGGGSASEALRGLVQQAEGLVDSVGKIPTPILETGVALIGTVGGIALAGGAFLKFTPKVLDSISAFRGLGTEGSRIPGMMGKVAKGAGIAMLALSALSIAAKASTRDVSVSTSDAATAVLKLTKAGEGVGSLDSMFQGWDTFLGSSTVGNINSASDAVARLSDVIHNGDGGQSWLSDNVISNLGGPQGYMAQIKERFDQVGESLGNLASSGSLEAASSGFSKLNKEFEANGLSARDALDAMPAYESSLLDLGQSVGVALEPAELLDLAMGKVPDRMAAAGFAVDGTATIIGSFTDAAGQAVPITEEMGKQLEEMGISAAGAVTELSKYVDLLVRAGLSTLSARDAQRGVIDAQVAFNESLAANGATLDINTKAGRDNEAALDSVASARISLMQSLASETDAYGNNIHTQEELQGVLKDSYNQLYDNAFAMTGNADAANDLAREALSIPKDVNIDTWMSDYAKQMAENTTGSLAGTQATASDLTGQLVGLADQINATPNKEIILTEPMSPQIKAGLQDLGYKVENLPDGTIRVTETGTDATGEKISAEARKQRIATITAQAETYWANIQLNDAAKPRTSTITAVMNTIRGTDSTVGAGTVLRAPQAYTGGSVDNIMGMYTGGVIPGAPPMDKRKDNVLALVNGRPLKVQSGEFLVNGESTRKHYRTLMDINNGTYQEAPGLAGGGRVGREYSVPATYGSPASGGSSAPSIDYDRLAAAINSRPVVANLRIGNRDVAQANIQGRKELRLSTK